MFWLPVAHHAVPTVAAAAAIIPVFQDLAVKSAQQQGKPIPRMVPMEVLRGGMKMSPIVGGIIGTQMMLQGRVEKALTKKDADKASLTSMVASSGVVAIVSAPILAIFNGQTMGWRVNKTIQKFSRAQGLSIVVQETAFVGGLSAADRLAKIMKRMFGNNKAVDYTAAFIAGTLGSLAGHPANTALTRLQNGLSVGSPRQLMWGAARRARAFGVFSVFYKLGKEVLNFIFENPK